MPSNESESEERSPCEVRVLLAPEEDAAIRTMASAGGIGVADYLRTLIRREARRFGHLPQGTGPYFTPREPRREPARPWSPRRPSPIGAKPEASAGPRKTEDV
jgi:hypothetical protein